MGDKAHRRKETKMWQKVKTWTKKPSGVVLAVILVITLVASFAVPVLAAESPPSFVLKWGTAGGGDGQFLDPRGIAVDTAGNVYVTAAGNNRIQKFTSTGTFITKWGSGADLSNPWGIDVSRDGYVYVADMSNNRIKKYTSTGTFVAQWGTGPGAGNGQFNAPYGLCVDSSGNVYVADCGNFRIQKFDSLGNFLTKWSTTGFPYDVAADASGNVYVADMGNSSIDKFTSTGTLLAQWGSGPGTGDGQFKAPNGVAVDASGNVYVADSSNNRIQKLTGTGVFLSKWGRNGGDGSSGSGNGEFFDPYTLVVTPWGYVYVADSDNNRVQLFAYPQTSSASVNTATGTGTATFTTSNGSIVNLTASATTPCGSLAGFSVPHGYFSFNITNITAGATVTITITLPSDMPTSTQYWKCINGQWVNVTSLLGDNDGDNVLTLTLTDGGLGDADGVANGTVVDPGGPAVAATVVAPASPRASPTLPTQLKPAQMSLLYLSVNPQQAAANQPVTISTNVVNTGDDAGNLNIALKINGQVEQTRMVSVGPQGTQPVKFTVAKAQPGTYTIDIGGQKGSFTILGTGSSTTNKNVSGGMIVVLIFGFLVIMAIAASLLARRHT
jgi:sugar lactone lactonase YvrE